MFSGGFSLAGVKNVTCSPSIIGAFRLFGRAGKFVQQFYFLFINLSSGHEMEC
jgi:hypothetical protein